MKENVMKFECGKIYQTRSICDYNCIFKIKVLSRTEKTINYLILGWPESSRPKRKARPFIYLGKETIYPLGKYSMAPVISACDL